MARHQGGGLTALVIDEAQSLVGELMEEIRLLANLETASEKLLPVVLAGQPELAYRLEQSDVRQLKQRIAVRSAHRGAGPARDGGIHLRPHHDCGR